MTSQVATCKINFSISVTFLTQLSTGALAVAGGYYKLQFFNLTTTSSIGSAKWYIGHSITAMVEISGVLYIADSGAILYAINEATQAITYTVGGFPAQIMAMKGSLDGSYFAVSMKNKGFGYYPTSVTNSSAATPLFLSIADSYNIISMDRYGNTFLTGDSGTGSSVSFGRRRKRAGSIQNNVWAWDVNQTSNALNGGSGVGIAVVSGQNVSSIACLNGTGILIFLIRKKNRISKFGSRKFFL
jgi:hypothetical protein